MLSKEQFGQPIRNMFANIADQFVEQLYSTMSSDLSGASFMSKDQIDTIMQSVRDELMQSVKNAFGKTLDKFKEANNGR